MLFHEVRAWARTNAAIMLDTADCCLITTVSLLAVTHNTASIMRIFYPGR